jgi:nitric oxide reductase NorD protein
MPLDQEHREPIESLHLLDPDLAATVQRQLERFDPVVAAAVAALLVDDIFWGLAREMSFGQAIAAGYLHLMTRVEYGALENYHRLVRAAGARGTTIGQLMAIHLVPVLVAGGRDLLQLFTAAVGVMEAKGIYTLTRPLEALSQLLNRGERSAAAMFLKLLSVAFGMDLSYNQCQHLSVNLSQAMLSFAKTKRVWQLEQLLRVVRADIHLIESFLEGMKKGLRLLTPAALDRFISAALDKTIQRPKSAASFLSLDSRQGRDTFAEFQVAVSLNELEAQLNRYLGARTGLQVSVRPLSALDGRPSPISATAVTACTDGRFIYLPEEIAVFGQKKANTDLYRCLARFESGHHEFGTFDFDLERLFDRCQALTDCRCALDGLRIPPVSDQRVTMASDLERFLDLFPLPALAADLFTVFEHGRIRRMLERRYPGLVRSFLPILQSEVGPSRGLMDDLYAVIALGLPPSSASGPGNVRHHLVKGLLAQFVDRTGAGDCRVESSGELVVLSYREAADTLTEHAPDHLTGQAYRPLQTPFDRRLRPDLVHAASQALDQKALALKERLAEKGFRIYRADLRKHLEAHQGLVGADDLAAVLENASNIADPGNPGTPPPSEELSVQLTQDLPELFDKLPPDDETEAQAVTWHPEWDCNLGDYLTEHTRVRDHVVTGCESQFYSRVLKRHRGLIKRIRTAFELLKPEGLKLYRQWIEGDAFDYRALLDFVLDKKAGITPSERLYIKRLKVNRDVAVLLLVDLSRSTANPVAGSTARVLDVAKEAIVLFSEALEVVGDIYAIAGFSGNGRLGVDYFHIKDFTEPMNRVIRNRIDAMAPQRNTRMGAAIRHAAAQFAAVSSRVRLLITIGDGFPNDLGYKKRYAVEDTRRAISELRSRHIHVHAITINIDTADDGRLDDLYGEIHHNVIANVVDLPEKLSRIYGMLTR